MCTCPCRLWGWEGAGGRRGGGRGGEKGEEGGGEEEEEGEKGGGGRGEGVAAVKKIIADISYEAPEAGGPVSSFRKYTSLLLGYKERGCGGLGGWGRGGGGNKVV